MADDVILTKLGEIQAGQKHISKEQDRARTETLRIVDTIHSLEKETTIGFGDIKADIATINEQVGTHRDQTRRSFETYRGYLDKHEARIDEVAGGGSNLKRDGAMVGGGGAFAVIMNKLLEFFSGGSGGTP